MIFDETLVASNFHAPGSSDPPAVSTVVASARETLHGLPLPPAQPPTHGLIGSIQLGCFRLEREIGRGSYGTTYLAEQIGFGRRAVVKVAHAHLFETHQATLVRKRFAEEVRAAARIDHPNLVTVFTAGDTSEGLPAIAMELVPGRTFEEVLQAAHGGLSPEVTHAVFAQLGSALAALHEHGVVHRDLSPRNVMVAAGPPIKSTILDFGVALLEDRPRMTRGAVGTPCYMAPEQVIGRAVPASDVFALGALLWWALTGQEYRSGQLALGVLCGITGNQRADPRDIVPALSPQVAKLVGRMLSNDPHYRPSAREFCTLWQSAGPSLHPQPARRSVTERASVPGAAARAPRGLVVDPNPITRHIMVGSLRRLGGSIQGTSDPRVATRSEPGDFDLVVISTELHEADPLDVAAYLSEADPDQWVLLSGSGTMTQAMKDAGVRDLVGVPAGLERLEQLFDRLYEERSMRESSRPGSLDAVDRTMLASLLRDDPVVIREAIELFMGETPELFALITFAYEHDQPEGIVGHCRALAQSAEALCANHLARLARAAVQLAREGQPDAIPGFVAEMENEYRLVFRSLMEIHASIPLPRSTR